jgi:hypothetical protein
MTEAEWLACDDPGAMLAYLLGRTTGRKLTCFALACVGASGDWDPDNGDHPRFYWAATWRSADGRPMMGFVSGWDKDDIWYEPWDHAAGLPLLRDVFGNPFRPVNLDPPWLTSTVLALATGMYASRDFSAMPILADALQDAGCEDGQVLAHCRGPGPHARGCWVVDLVLGKG